MLGSLPIIPSHDSQMQQIYRNELLCLPFLGFWRPFKHEIADSFPCEGFTRTADFYASDRYILIIGLYNMDKS